MVKKCYLLNNDDATIAAISRIINRIPCFIDAKAVSSNRFELKISVLLNECSRRMCEVDYGQY